MAQKRKPKRIQRKRTRGWRMPAGAVYVGRPTVYGNPFKPGPDETLRLAVANYRDWLTGSYRTSKAPPSLGKLREELQGKDLVCWCPLDQPCHADILLEIANHT